MKYEFDIENINLDIDNFEKVQDIICHKIARIIIGLESDEYND